MKVLITILVVVIAILLAPNFLPEPYTPNKVSELPKQIQDWFATGKITTINGRKMFYIHEKCQNPKIKDPQTFAILHGYPSSSFEYHKVISSLLQFGNVIIHDHIGFGLSEKPIKNYTYSIVEAADNTLALWRHVAVRKAHVFAHDMGDTVLTEIISRRYRRLLPEYFDDFFQSITFTNGGMKYSLINKRFGQIILSNQFFGPILANIAYKFGISAATFRREVGTLWPHGCDAEQKSADIGLLLDLHNFNGGIKLACETIYYLWDRAHFEFRWFQALENIDIPTRFIWGESDPVAPVLIPRFFMDWMPKNRTKFEFVEGCGHFWMLEKPKVWVDKMVQCLN